MAIFLSIFNNKGGVGKTTYMYHIGHILAENGKKTLLAGVMKGAVFIK